MEYGFLQSPYPVNPIFDSWLSQFQEALQLSEKNVLLRGKSVHNFSCFSSEDLFYPLKQCRNLLLLVPVPLALFFLSDVPVACS